jgi:uncharacterized protein (TIGR00730 family)
MATMERPWVVFAFSRGAFHPIRGTGAEEYRPAFCYSLFATDYSLRSRLAMPTDAPNAAHLASPSYRLAVEDTAFLLRDEMRATRFALEYSKADLILRDWGVRSTVIVFGSARIPSPDASERELATADSPESRKLAERRAALSHWYREARSFGRIVSERGGALVSNGRFRDNVIATGGGPGIMEAANRGAADAGAPSIGFNITLPHEQEPNAYATPELTFRFHYFAMRKMHLAMRAAALVVFPGGFGTLDELFETMTLVQTGKSRQRPILLFGRDFWQRLIDFDYLVETGMIGPGDPGLVRFVETAEEAWEVLATHYGFDLPPTQTGEFAVDI